MYKSYAGTLRGLLIVVMSALIFACGKSTPTKDAGKPTKLVAQQSLETLSESQNLKYLKGLGLLRQDKYPQAERIFSSLRNRAPGLVEVLLNLGLSFYHQEKYAEANKVVLEALAINTTLDKGYNLGGLISMQLGEVKFAETNFQQAVSQTRIKQRSRRRGAP